MGVVGIVGVDGLKGVADVDVGVGSFWPFGGNAGADSTIGEAGAGEISGCFFGDGASAGAVGDKVSG